MSNHDSLWDSWAFHAKVSPQKEAIIHWNALGQPFRWTYKSLLDAALQVAEKLIHQGVKSGDTCALIIRHNKYFYPVYMAISAIGAVPAVLAYPNVRLHPDKFLSGLSGIAEYSGLDWVITERELDDVIRPLTLNGRTSVRGAIFPMEWLGQDSVLNGVPNIELINKQRPRDSSSCLLQFSSGTTGLQKGIALSHKCVIEHIRRYTETIAITPKDKIVSWLPLYHDMGLIAAFHMPLATGITSVQLDPFQWVTAPVILLQAIHEERGTLTWLPNFAYHFMADRVRDEDMEGISLASMRMFINCSEVVRNESHDKFLARFGKYGVNKTSLSACYAMAEATYAVTQTRPGSVATVVCLEREPLSRKVFKFSMDTDSARACVSSGSPISGCALKVVDKEANELGEGKIGEIAIKSEFLFEEYKNNPLATEKAVRDGWYYSGDIGFSYKGEYFILGRWDDTIIIAGNNIFPEDIEDAVNRVKGVIPGRAVAFGIDDPEAGTQKICVIAETLYKTGPDKDCLRLEIMQAGMAINVTISIVHLVPPRWLIKSSSGKLSRKANKERFLKGLQLGECQVSI